MGGGGGDDGVHLVSEKSVWIGGSVVVTFEADVIGVDGVVAVARWAKARRW